MAGEGCTWWANRALITLGTVWSLTGARAVPTGTLDPGLSRPPWPPVRRWLWALGTPLCQPWACAEQGTVCHPGPGAARAGRVAAESPPSSGLALLSAEWDAGEGAAPQRGHGLPGSQPARVMTCPGHDLPGSRPARGHGLPGITSCPGHDLPGVRPGRGHELPGSRPARGHGRAARGRQRPASACAPHGPAPRGRERPGEQGPSPRGRRPPGGPRWLPSVAPPPATSAPPRSPREGRARPS